MFQIRTVLAGFAFSILFNSASFARDANLPGGANTLSEAHGDWTVACALVSVPDGNKTKRCVLSQLQISRESRQRALAIELRPESEAAKGTLVLPFGLALQNGIAYQLDDGAVGAVQPFRTCLPVGCLVDVAFDASTVTSLRAGNVLNVKATADGGQEMVFSVSLSGFSSAHARVVELLR
jgi:invasion protein IalB